MIVSRIQLCDPIPSAIGVTISIRSVLWGIVESVIKQNDPNDTSNLNLRRDDDFFEDAQASARLQLQQEMSTFTAGVVEDVYDLPLSFGKSEHQGKKSKKRMKINYLRVHQDYWYHLGQSHYDNSAEMPSDFKWNVLLPLPSDELYLEDNLFSFVYPSQGLAPVGSTAIDPHVETYFRTVRMIGYGPSSPSTISPTRDEVLTENEINTAIIEFVDSRFEEKGTRCKVERRLLRTFSLDEGNGKDTYDAVMSMLYHTSPPDSTEKYDEVHGKYWDQRYRLFSLFDKGVRMDSESWFSVTPEIISIYIAQRCRIGAEKLNKFLSEIRKSEKKKKKLTAFLSKQSTSPSRSALPLRSSLALDLFCGCGGNSIPLASVFDSVMAVDINPEKLPDARINAKIYGVESRIDFICADAYHVLSSFIQQHPCEEKGSGTNSFEKNPPPKVDVVILAPPWGGPDYNVSKHFDMRTGFPSGDGLELIKLALRVSENVVCIFPKNLSKAQLKEFITEEDLDGCCNIDEIFLYQKHKMSVIFFGSLFRP